MAFKKGDGDKVREAIEQFVKNLVRREILSAPYNQTKNGQVTKVSPQGYTVSIENKEYPNMLAIDGTAINVGDVVVCNIPNGQMSQAYIVGRLVGSVDDTGGSGLNNYQLKRLYQTFGLYEPVAFTDEGIYWNVKASIASTDEFLSNLSPDPQTGGMACCIIHFNNGYGIYSVDLTNMGGTGYAIAAVLEEQFLPVKLIYVSESNAINDGIISSAFGLSVANSGWQNDPTTGAHAFFGDNDMQILANGLVPNPNDRKYKETVNAFFGTSTYLWDLVDALI